MTDQLLTVVEVAEQLRRDPATVRRMIARGDLEASPVGGRLLIREQAIDELLERTRVQPVVPEPRRSWAGGHVPLPASPQRAPKAGEPLSVRERVRQRREKGPL